MIAESSSQLLLVLVSLLIHFETFCGKTRVIGKSDFTGRSTEALEYAREFFNSYGVTPGLEISVIPSKKSTTLATYPTELKNALRSEEPKLRLAAINYLYSLAVLIQHSEPKNNRHDSHDRFRLALGVHAKPIVVSLDHVINVVPKTDELKTAGLVLLLDSKHSRATAILATQLAARDPQMQQDACRVVGALRLSQATIMKSLAKTIESRNRKVREAAMMASWRLGNKTKQLDVHFVNSPPLARSGIRKNSDSNRSPDRNSCEFRYMPTGGELMKRSSSNRHYRSGKKR